MKLKHLPYHLGLIVPCALIILNGSCTYYSTIRYGSDFAQNCFGAAYAVVWLTYALAIFTSPGYTDGSIDPEGKYVTCTKCNLPKPERAHHCKTCGRCVLRMDHHCPWTENCVGFRNLPHFVRFLSAAMLLCAYGVFKNGGFLIYAVEHRRHLAYFVPNKSRIWMAGIGLLGSLFVMLTLLALWFRVVIDTLNGKTQIENWECERVEALARRKLAPAVEYPFDVDIFTNAISAFGDIWLWFLPWATPSGSGHSYPRMVECDDRWPPVEKPEITNHDFYRIDRWTSIEGESLSDFGVDLAMPPSTEKCDITNNENGMTTAMADDEDIPLADLRSRNM